MASTYEEPVGKVIGYDPDHHTANVRSDRGSLHVGDMVHIQGTGTEVEARIDALQGADGPAEVALPADDVGMTVDLPVEEGAVVFKVTDPYDREGGSVLDALFDA